MAKRKNMGKVKRYNRSFYSGSQTAKRVLAWIVAIVVISLLGYFVAPYVLDFGTRTWYSAMDVLRGDGAADEQEPAIEATPIPTPIPTPAPTPEPIGIVEGNWTTVALSALTSPELIAQTVEELRAQGITYVLIPLKDSAGYIHYPSTVSAAGGSIAATTVDAPAIVTAFTRAGMVPVAGLCAFQDPIAGEIDRALAIRYSDTEYKWLDNTPEAGGKSWLNPYAAESVQFISDLIAEVEGFGFAHVCLSAVQFPAQVSTSQNFGDVGAKTRGDAIAGAISAFEMQAADRVVVWYQYPYSAYLAQDMTIGGVLPSELGAENVLITMPIATTANPDPDKSALQSVLTSVRETGATHVVVQEENIGAFQ